ncbi:hypothetical protein [Streptomyces sp. NPDC005283]|uniref:hypothetical protein n=1 Tax=Streptomyces sp. NPDC005283 TaxID=3156871 RepID=UPI003455AB19
MALGASGGGNLPIVVNSLDDHEGIAPAQIGHHFTQHWWLGLLHQTTAFVSRLQHGPIFTHGSDTRTSP